MDIRQESLKKHYEWKGKIEVISRVPVNTREDLSLAYTPGVAEPCLEINKDINKSYELTRRSNLVAVITDGTAILGLGDIGPEAGMPWKANALCSKSSQMWTHSRFASNPKMWMKSSAPST